MLLRKLKNKHKARKEDSDLAMHFLEVYTHHFEARRKEIKSVLEIGVQYGGSLKMWRDYFPNAQITGLDINKKCRSTGANKMSNAIGIIIVFSFMAFCLHGTYLLLTKEDEDE